MSDGEEIETVQGWWCLTSRDRGDNKAGLDVAGEWQARILKHRERKKRKIREDTKSTRFALLPQRRLNDLVEPGRLNWGYILHWILDDEPQVVKVIRQVRGNQRPHSVSIGLNGNWHSVK